MGISVLYVAHYISLYRCHMVVLSAARVSVRHPLHGDSLINPTATIVFHIVILYLYMFTINQITTDINSFDLCICTHNDSCCKLHYLEWSQHIWHLIPRYCLQLR